MPPEPAGSIRLVAIRVRNFRCLRSIDVTLDRVTVLIGENNAGKTSFLEALYVAIGVGPRTFTEEDIHLAPGETSPPLDRRVTIDILIRPTNAKGEVIRTFPGSSPWLALWGEGVSQSDDDDDIIGIRTQAKWDDIRGDYDVTRVFLRDWPATLDDAHTTSPKSTKKPAASFQIEPIALYLLDAKRDIAADLRNRSSFWSRLVSDPGLSPETVTEIETTLNTVNERIVDGSTVLTHLQSHLAVLSDSIPGIANSITVTPVARHLRDLTKGMDVLLSGKNAATFPLARQGMGTRSVATLLTFRAYAEWKQQHAKGAAVHPLLAIEEPETHLHPHAQRALFKQLHSLPGQCIISTHSPYISGQANVLNFRHFRRDAGHITTRQLRKGDLTPEDLRKIHRQVIHTRGDMLFAKVVILVSGETEEQALPEFANAFFEKTCHENGISIIGVSGDANYLPFLRLADSFGIPWYVFSDGEPNAIRDVNNALNAIKQPPIGANPRVFVIDKNRDFETFLAEEYHDELTQTVIDMNAVTPQHREALIKTWATKTTTDLVTELQNAKTRYGRPCAETLIALHDEKRRFPALIGDLLAAVKKELQPAP